MDGHFLNAGRTHLATYKPGMAGTGAEGMPDAAVTLLMRDGSRMALDLADPWRQAPELASALAPRHGTGEVLTLDLVDGSRLMLSPSEIMGLHLPPDRPSTALAQLAPSGQLPAMAAERMAEEITGARLLQLGARRVLRITDFLPPEFAGGITAFALSREAAFEGSKVLSNDPEYRKSNILYSFQPYEGMFRAALREAFPSLCDTLGVAAFELAQVECQLTATFHGGYFKPHVDNAASLSHRHISYVYYFHRQPRPFLGGDLRFFDHNPFAVEQPDIRHTLDVAPLHNSIIFFESSCMHEVREVVCEKSAFENARFTINGWLGHP